MRAEPRLSAPSGAPPPATASVAGSEIELEPLAREACRRHRSEHADESARYGEAADAWCVHDTLYLLAWAAAEDRFGAGQLLANVTWLARVLHARRFPAQRLVRHLELTADVLAASALTGAEELADRLRGAARSLDGGVAPDRPPAGSPVSDAYLSALLRGDPRGARLVVDAAVDAGMALHDVYLDVFQPALYEVGRRWQNAEATVAQEHLATATTQTLVARLSARLAAEPAPGRTAIVTGTEGELHALGPRFVGDFLEGEGWTVIDLGAATPTEDLVRAVADHRPELVCLSTTLPTNLRQAEAAILALRRLPDRPLIAVGGGAYRHDPGLAASLGADLHAADAAGFLEVIAGT